MATATAARAHPAAGAGLRLGRRTRRGLLVAHVVVSVAWLGLDLGLLALGITGKTSADPVTSRGAYLVARLLVDWVVIPVSLLSLLTGLVLGLGTHWGLLRYRWVAVKLWLTLAATAATAFALRVIVGQAAHAVATGAVRPAARTANDLITAPSVALAVYTFLTALSVVKPWGRTRPRWRERRLRTGGCDR